MVPRTATPESATADAPWEHAGRLTSWEEGHGRGGQNVPTAVQSAEAYDDRTLRRKAEARLCRWSVIDKRRSPR
jgi:hypothetical protein